MTCMRRLGFGVAALVMLGCQHSAPMTTDEIVARHTAARGGATAIERVASIRVDLEITEPGFTVRGRYVASREGYARIDIFAGDERVFTEAVSPHGGWQLLRDPSVASDLSPDGERILRRGLVGNLYGLHELQGLGYRVSLAGQDISDGRTVWTVDRIAPDGMSTRLYIDGETFLISGNMETTALHPDIDSAVTLQWTAYGDFRPEAGVMYSRRSEKSDVTTGEVIQTLVITNVEINPSLDPAVFDRPR